MDIVAADDCRYKFHNRLDLLPISLFGVQFRSLSMTINQFECENFLFDLKQLEPLESEINGKVPSGVFV